MSNLKLILILVFLAGCSTEVINNVVRVSSPVADDLTFAEARTRAGLLSEIVYELKLSVDEHSDIFKGTLKAGFNLGNLTEDLRMDFREGEIKSLTINKLPVVDFKYDHTAVWLPKSQLASGLNIVEINYQHRYSHDGVGLHRFKDVEDGEVYLFSSFEPFSARKMFPCFDQPDLKATMTLTVVAPAHWQVTSTTMETKKKTIGNSREWQFATTPKISTYLFSVAAGPFRVWSSKAGNIPLRLMARKSFAKNINSNWWLRITSQGLDFYNSYFGFPYPFAKYDQVIITELSPTAMENVANVTFNEKLISRSPQPTREEQVRAANVILHEMAHMWFGDIVTMKWWNDLWLNESFATYMSSLAEFETTEYKETWRRFFVSDKSWAYYEDQLVTTHPIEAPVESIEQARANFDGITYGKGASVIKQLAYYIGKENFKRGVRGYIKKYSYKNAELADFIGSLQDAAPEKNLQEWARVWLKEAGVDSLESEIACTDNKIERVQLNVKSATSSFRPHALQVATFEKKKNKLLPSQLVAVELKTSNKEIVELKGKPCPEILMPNYNDHDYIKVKLDSNSIKNLKEQLSVIEDPLVRLMSWNYLWQMVLDQKLPLQEFVGIFKSQLKTEKDLKILDRVTGYMVGTDFSEHANVLYFYPRTPERSDLVKYLEDIFWENAMATKVGSDEFMLWMDKAAHASETKPALERLSKILANKDLNQDLRWQILGRLCRFNFTGSLSLLMRESINDKSERGIRAAMACNASYPEPNTKSVWLDRLLTTPSQMPMAQEKAVMRSLFPPEQKDLRLAHSNIYFDVLKNTQGNRDKYFVEEFATYLMPVECNGESSKRLTKFIGENKSLDFSVVKALLVGQQEDARCFGVRSLALNHAVQNQ